MTPLSLDGDWSLADANGDQSCTLTLPGDGISALHAADLIPDPYWGRNEYDLRWICERDWTAKRTFEADRTDLALVISMLDTVATVRVFIPSIRKSWFSTVRSLEIRPDAEENRPRCLATAATAAGSILMQTRFLRSTIQSSQELRRLESLQISVQRLPA